MSVHIGPDLPSQSQGVHRVQKLNISCILFVGIFWSIKKNCVNILFYWSLSSRAWPELTQEEIWSKLIMGGANNPTE